MENKLYSGLTIFPKPYSCCEANKGGSGDSGSSASLVLGLYQTGLTIFPKPYICCEANKKAGSNLPEGNYLFKNQRFEGGVPLTANLPVPVEGVSYTLFIDGVEIGTSDAFYDEPEDCTGFWVNDDNGHVLVYSHGGWSGRPDGRFSLRIND